MSSLAFSNPHRQVFSVEELHAECVRLNLPPLRPAIRRVRRAIALAASGAVSFQKHADEGRIYRVRSQNSDDVYTVTVPSVDLELAPSDCFCTCPDSAQKQNTCKHAIAVVMSEEIQRELIADERDVRHLVDRSISHLLPDSYERLLMAQQ